MPPIKLLMRTSILFAILLAACVGGTPTLRPDAAGSPVAPSLTPLPAGYPPIAPAATSNPSAYPGKATEAATSVVTSAATSETAVDTAAPTATSTTAPPPAPVTITYQDFEIVPSQTTIKVGTKVIFRIKSASKVNHEPFSNTPPYNFDSGPGLVDGQTYTFTFNKAGTITIACGYHEKIMHATVIIEP